MQVFCSRKNQYGNNEERNNKLMIPRAIKEISIHNSYVPDIKNYDSKNSKKMEERIIDSLCSFDLLYCYCMFSGYYNKFKQPAYPASLGFHPKRVKPISLEFANNEKMRNVICSVDDKEIVKGIEDFKELVDSQCYGTFYSEHAIVPCLDVLRKSNN